LAMQLPVIVERNAFTLPQERYNADWILEQDAGLVLRNFREIGGAVRHMLQPEVLARMRANAKAIKNRAVFEIPGILKEILGR
ncbi:MAG TPA: galactosyldiacylglycerol synthase, partial [Bryobacteraceae bacterium]|nr:galactosyldiacylglycerol synthase [Bryobacteraceae bacterium]